jgi:glucose-6-phosphate 1-dehydrogenase
MEEPAAGDEDGLRSARTRVLASIKPLEPANVVRGQFVGYRSEPGVAADSRVETYAAVRLDIDSWRWAGVPFYIRTGKRLPVTCTEVMVELRRPPRSVFGEFIGDPGFVNYVRFRLGPNVAIALGVRSKKPGEALVGAPLELLTAEDDSDKAGPYERLLGDALKGDPSLFAREDTVEAAWRVVQPILGNASPVFDYAPGTWGPGEAERMASASGGWRDPRAVPSPNPA